VSGAYEIRDMGGGFSVIYAPAPGGLTVAGSVCVLEEARAVILRRRWTHAVCIHEAGGCTPVSREEVVRLPLRASQSIGIAHDLLVQWAAEAAERAR